MLNNMEMVVLLHIPIFIEISKENKRLNESILLTLSSWPHGYGRYFYYESMGACGKFGPYGHGW